MTAGPSLDAADHRLLAIDRLAGLHGVDRHLGVPVVGNADQDGVDVFAAEDLAIVDVGLDLVAEDFLGVGAPAFIQVGGGDQLDAGDLEGDVGIDEADDPHADRGDLNALVRAGRPWMARPCGFSSWTPSASAVVVTVAAAEAAATDLRNERRESLCG